MLFEEREEERFGLVAGDILVCEGGEPGRAAIWDGHIAEMKYQKAIHRVRPGPAVRPEWIVYQLKSDAENGDIGQYLTGTTIRHFTGKALAEYLIRLPPFEEQGRIITKLEALRARSRRAREALDEVPALLEKLRQSILAAAFRGDLTKDWRAKNPDVEPAEKLLQRIRTERRKKWEEAELAKLKAKGKAPTDDRWKDRYADPKPVDSTELPHLPSGWCWASVDELSSAVSSVCYGVVQPGEDDVDGVPLIRVCDLLQDGFTVDQASLRRIPNGVNEDYERSQLQGGELLVSVVGTIGRTAVVPHALKGANIARAIARMVFEVRWLSEWTAFWFGSAYMQHRLNSDSREVARKTLNIAQLIEMPIPLASGAEVARVLRALRSARSAISELRSKADLTSGDLRDLDRTLLSKAFRGELVPQDPADEPADVMLARLKASAGSPASAPTSSPASGKRRGRAKKA